MKIQLPAHFTDVTLREYIAWHQSAGEARLSIFIKDTNKMKLNARSAAYAHLCEIMENEVPQFFDRVRIGDKTYGFINDWDNFTTGEWIDVETYTKDELGNAHKLMSIWYRPVTRQTKDTYEIEEYKGTKDSEIWLDEPASYYLGAVVFFCKKRSELLRTSGRSLMEIVRAMTSPTGGGGTTSYLTWQEMTSSRWRRLRSYLLGKFSLIWRMLWIRKEKRARDLDN